MDLLPLAVTFGLVFLAELPDKTAIATLVLSSRYRGTWVFAGVAVAFAIQVAIAVVAGTFLAQLPQRPVEFAVSVVFLVSAVLLWRESMKHSAQAEELEEQELVAKLDSQSEASEPITTGETGEAQPASAPGERKGFLRVASLSFTIVFLAEFLDLTQIMTANLAIKYNSPWEVAIGAYLALCSVAAIAIVGGKALLKVLPLKTITRAASILLFGLAAYSLFEVITG